MAAHARRSGLGQAWHMFKVLFDQHPTAVVSSVALGGMLGTLFFFDPPAWSGRGYAVQQVQRLTQDPVRDHLQAFLSSGDGSKMTSIERADFAMRARRFGYEVRDSVTEAEVRRVKEAALQDRMESMSKDRMREFLSDNDMLSYTEVRRAQARAEERNEMARLAKLDIPRPDQVADAE